MYVLDLCCGTQSLKEKFISNGYNYVGLDINNITDGKPADIVSDIKKWNYHKYFFDNGLPSFIFFSPPCREYSILNNALPNKTCDIKGSNEIVKKGIEIIKYCKCGYVIENPQTSKLKNQDFMVFPYTDVDYCAYGYPYKKRTRLWNNISLIGEKCKKKLCPFKKKGRHIYSVGNATYNTNLGLISPLSRLGQRYSIPSSLIEYIIKQIKTI
jgi:hypothetical protein